jgi:cytidylate kinase
VIDRGAGPVVTLDGPAGAGKSTTAQAVADALGFRHLDSGALYRALTLALLRRGVPPERWPELSEADLASLGVSVDPAAPDFRVLLDGSAVTEELRTDEVTAWVSHLASLPAARACLLDLQRSAGAAGRLVADGRDMGSVVFPDADVKVYLVADLKERARRRLEQVGHQRPSDDDVAVEAQAIEDRDRRDRERSLSPLRKPEGASEIDTTALTFDEQVEAIVGLVRALTGPPPPV